MKTIKNLEGCFGRNKQTWTKITNGKIKYLHSSARNDLYSGWYEVVNNIIPAGFYPPLHYTNGELDNDENWERTKTLFGYVKVLRITKTKYKILEWKEKDEN